MTLLYRCAATVSACLLVISCGGGASTTPSSTTAGPTTSVAAKTSDDASAAAAPLVSLSLSFDDGADKVMAGLAQPAGSAADDPSGRYWCSDLADAGQGITVRVDNRQTDAEGEVRFVELTTAPHDGSPPYSGHIEIELAGETVLTLEAASVDVHPELMTGEFSGVSAAGVTVTGSFRCGG